MLIELTASARSNLGPCERLDAAGLAAHVRALCGGHAS